jgi:hypothetical protein
MTNYDKMNYSEKKENNICLIFSRLQKKMNKKLINFIFEILLN